MKRILVSLAMIILLGVTAFGATKAYFVDSTHITGITVSSGNANLKINNLGSSGWIDEAVLDYESQWATRWDAGGWYRDYFSLEKPIMWYPGLVRGDGFYLGNFSASRIGLDPVISLKNYTETITGLDSVFLLKVSGGGVDSGYQTLAWWRTNSLSLNTIAWCESPAWNTCGTVGVSASLKMSEAADNTYANGQMEFDLNIDATQAY